MKPIKPICADCVHLKFCDESPRAACPKYAPAESKPTRLPCPTCAKRRVKNYLKRYDTNEAGCPKCESRYRI